MSAIPPKGSEAEFLYALRLWQPATHVANTRAHVIPRKHGGPGARQAAAAAAAAAAADPAIASRYFLYLEQAPSADAASAAASAASASAAASSAAAAAAPAPSRATSLHLLASNVAGSWRGVLDHSAFRRHRDMLGIGSTSWVDVFKMVAECFASPGRVLLTLVPAESMGGAAAGAGDDDADFPLEDDAPAQSPSSASSSSARALKVTLRYNIGSEVELEGSFTMQPVLRDDDDDDAEDGRSATAAASASSSGSDARLSAPMQLLSHLLFGVFSRSVAAEAAQVKPLQAELARVRREAASVAQERDSLRVQVRELESERSSWLSSSGGGGASAGSYGLSSGTLHGGASLDVDGMHSGGGGGQSPAKRKAPPAKAKNMSILNPLAKRRKTGAIKIEG